VSKHQEPPPFAVWLVRNVVLSLFRLIYRVTARGAEKLPEGGFLLLPNHLTWIDAIVLQAACPRPIRFIVWEDYYRNRRLAPLMRFFGVLPISNKRAKDTMKLSIEALQRGEVVCIFPEGSLSRSGTLLRLQRGYELMARQAKVPVVAAWMDQLWGSIFSYRGGRFFWKWPNKWRYPVTVAFGKSIAAREAGIDIVRQEFLALGEECYQQREFLRGSIAAASLKGLMRNGSEVSVIDGMDGSKLTRTQLLAASLALSRLIRAQVPEKRVAIVLPSSKGAMIANLAVMLAGNIPVNLNFTAGRAALEASIRKAGIRFCITAGAVKEKLKDFPWPEREVLLEKIVPTIKPSAIRWGIAVKVLPYWFIRRIAGVSAVGDREEAFLLFTSGSSGEPKGVALTHRNLLANANQFGEMLDLGSSDVIMGALPFFHSFGATVCLVFPMIEGIKVVTYPNPLETGKCAALIEKYSATVMLATPTFLRGYMKRAEPQQLRTVRLAVTGAEKLPDDLALAFQARFGVGVLQGYGLTETSPVASFNLPDRDPEQPSSRLGSSGKLVPGLTAEIRDPETEQRVSLHSTGMLWLKGPNVFDGYLDDPERTADVIKDGWFRTGDLARFDEDGFLWIEGRLSRFSKIGGEMVPHETVENKIVECLGLNSEGERVVMLTAVPDEAKGEALVVLSTRPIDTKDLREKLTAAGFTNLWIPKRIQQVEKIPILASGKLDLQACKTMAEQGGG
jgi:acyl-[acyl-carrier-protein]-phospholipid O-acyltransferase / long-chain-fatty-acid--[acyl-carrier-protein] ligase